MQSKLILGDNLKILKTLESESVELCYIDPPFFLQRKLSCFTTDGSKLLSFDDKWQSREAYLEFLKERICEIWRVLKKGGVLCVHCDWHANAYIRVHILDRLERVRFINEIIWKRKAGCGATNHKAKCFGNSTDTILVCSKHTKNTFNSQFTFDDVGYQEYIDKTFRHVDADGRRYRIDDIASPSPRQTLMYEYKGYKPPKNGWALSLKKMEQFEREGRLHFPKSKNGRIQRKRFLDELQGKQVQNLWTDIPFVNSQTKERVNYPTQKPLALLKRIITTFSNKGDAVLDAFCGSGTTLVAAQELERDFIGIDSSEDAVALTRRRLEAARTLYSRPFETVHFGGRINSYGALATGVQGSVSFAYTSLIHQAPNSLFCFSQQALQMER
jgi:DNA modification methylase